jgi:hypothetical protein
MSLGQDKYNGQKMMSSTKSTIFLSFYKKKQGHDMVLWLMWLRRPQPNFNNFSENIRKRTQQYILL